MVVLLECTCIFDLKTLNSLRSILDAYFVTFIICLMNEDVNRRKYVLTRTTSHHSSMHIPISSVYL
ncbi:hypothetical protein HK407_02g02620 [Ordospora pajunii]|uniref:uncharacterized protein n=1 Tax=Ordospora pajunii TaxID=3039483 RepID=UPI0029527A54|nr:uncharacterized protein HK407_02g02620 [Ordospora pajunii]KAH9412040.1 hypothetical protein HK407_02g02620 [Ordospora pajunii]